MSENNNIYSKAIPFIIMTAVVILFGTIVVVFIPMMTKEMHPKLENLKPYTAIELAGRDLYQKEGCFNCHTQTVRPLRADVLRYGDYSKAGENYYEHPFLWGSKRTGHDLARIGGKYPDQWHIEHFKNPQSFFPMSNMPQYDFLANKKVNINQTVRGMKALGYPYTEDEIKKLEAKTELDAMVAYMQVIGSSVERKLLVSVSESDYNNVTNPLKSDTAALDKGRLLYNSHCADCHGTKGQGTEIAAGMDFNASSSIPDGQMFVSIANGIDTMMPEHINIMTKNDIWSLVSYCRLLAAEESAAETK